MSRKLTETITSFLRKYWDGARPVLLGLSGGPDSLALFYLLLEHQDLPIWIAHVDHGWRPESGEEALQLKKLAEAHNIPFFETKLEPESLEGNLEAACRQARLDFFSSLCGEYGCQAVLLAHHQGDQAETVLKGLFEGAHRCSGMRPETKIEGLEIWRPLLGVVKEELVAFLDARGVVPFIDPTNRDSRFLRGRMRQDIIPNLQENYGKNIASRLCAIGQDFEELDAFLENHLRGPLDAVESNPWGSFLDCTQFPQVDFPLEMKYLLRKIAQSDGMTLSREILEKAAQHLVSRAANRQYHMGTYQIFIDRGALFTRCTPFVSLPQDRVPLFGTSQYGEWSVEVVEGDAAGTNSSWRDVWNGSAYVAVPETENSYEIGPPLMQSPYRDISSLDKWWNNHNVPAFLRNTVPVLWQGGVVVHEFLSGKTLFSKSQEAKTLRFTR